MNAIRNRDQLVQPVARILWRLLSGFTLATGVREYLHAARSGVAHGSSRAALGLRPTIWSFYISERPLWGWHPCLPGAGRRSAGPPARRETCAQFRSSRTPASNPVTPKTSPVSGTAKRGVWRQVPGLHSKERAGEANPLTSANSPRSLPPPPAPQRMSGRLREKLGQPRLGLWAADGLMLSP